jgi:hypothetical protein
MKLNKKQYFIIILAVFSVVILYNIFNYIDFLIKKGYYVECFDSNIALYKDTGSPTTTHSVDLPLTSKYSCKNFCAPATARCAISGEQCMADIDCRGCNPYGSNLYGSYNKSPQTDNVPGQNDAGKLTWGVTPTYSTLTTDIGTQAKLYTSNKKLLDKPLEANFGVNTWTSDFKEGQELFDERYKPAGLNFMPKYDKRYSVTGQFTDEGPLASNAYLK